MPHDPFYASRAWQKMRGQVLRDCEGACAIPGCRNVARHVDHRESRRRRPDLALDRTNLVPLCGQHHNAKTNRTDGGFGHALKAMDNPYHGMIARGCDAAGMPIDPSHHWNRKAT